MTVNLNIVFVVTFLNFGVAGSTELTKQVVDASRPTVNFEDIDLPIYNSRIRLAGRYNLDALSITLRDDASGEVQKLVGQQVQKQFDFMEQASARSGIDYKFTTRLEVLDGGNGVFEAQVLDTFEMYGCYLASANYGDMNYSSNEPMTVALSIIYDNFVQFAAGDSEVSIAGGIGARVGRSVSSQATTGNSGR